MEGHKIITHNPFLCNVGSTKPGGKFKKTYWSNDKGHTLKSYSYSKIDVINESQVFDDLGNYKYKIIHH